MDEAGIGKVDILVPILFQDALNCYGTAGELNRNLERAISDVLKNGFGGTWKTSRQITSLCNDRFASG